MVQAHMQGLTAHSLLHAHFFGADAPAVLPRLGRRSSARPSGAWSIRLTGCKLRHRLELRSYRVQSAVAAAVWRKAPIGASFAPWQLRMGLTGEGVCTVPGSTKHGLSNGEGSMLFSQYVVLGLCQGAVCDLNPVY